MDLRGYEMSSARRAVATVAAVAATLATPVAAGAAGTEGSLFREPVQSRLGVVAAEHRLAAEAGREILERGGNAMDAAMATMFAVGVVRPELCGIGGGGFLVHRSAKGQVASLDFRETAPAKYTYTAGIGGPLPGTTVGFGTGHNVVGVPGLVDGADEALRRFGSMRLADVIAPAERLAREGFPVSAELAAGMSGSHPRLLAYAETRRVYLKDGALPYAAGEHLVLSDLARTLRLIAAGGADAFYRGPIAQAIAADMQAIDPYPGGQGTMTAADLASYEAKWRAPVRTTYRDATIIGMGAPSSGGIAIAQMLNVLEGFDVAGGGPLSADRLHLVAEAAKLAWADRARYLGDPDQVDVPEEQLVSKSYAAQRRALVSVSEARDPGAGEVTSSDTGMNTTNLSVVDRQGNAVSVNCSLEQGFGSAVVAPGTGFLLNNQLTDFEAVPASEHPNGWAPGKRPRSSQSPAIVVRNGVPVLVTGGQGGPLIISNVANAIVNAVDFGMDPARAIDAPRSFARGACDVDSGLQLCLEEGRVGAAVVEDLRGRGHEVTSLSDLAPGCAPWPAGEGCEYWLSTRSQAAGVDPVTRRRLAASDPRNELAGADEAGLGAVAQARR